MAGTARVNRSFRVFKKWTTLKTTSLIDGSFEPHLEFRVESKVYAPRLWDVNGRRSDSVLGYYFVARYQIFVKKCFVDTKNSILYDLNGAVIEESTSWSKDHIVSTSIPNPVLVAKFLPEVDSRSASVLSNNGYYHWLIEDLPAYLLTKSLDPKLETIVPRIKAKYVQDFLDYSKTIALETERFAKCNNINFISRGDDTGWPHPEDIAFLRNYFAKELKPANPNNRVYISRENSTRSPVYEGKLVSYLRQSGWTILNLEDMNFISQIHAVSSAAVICGVHGAGLANMIWMSPGSKVIEIGGPEFRTCFRNLAKVSGLQFHRIESDAAADRFEVWKINDLE